MDPDDGIILDQGMVGGCVGDASPRKADDEDAALERRCISGTGRRRHRRPGRRSHPPRGRSSTPSPPAQNLQYVVDGRLRSQLFAQAEPSPAPRPWRSPLLPPPIPAESRRNPLLRPRHGPTARPPAGFSHIDAGRRMRERDKHRRCLTPVEGFGNRIDVVFRHDNPFGKSAPGQGRQGRHPLPSINANPSPTASTVPAISAPGVKGSGGFS